MSAWVVSKTHLDLLITAGLLYPNMQCRGAKLQWRDPSENPSRWHELDYDNADQVGVMLWAANYRSVGNRYPDAEGEEDGLPGPEDFSGATVLTYTHRMVPGPLDPVVVLKALACYEYQSCEHDGWKTSAAKAFCAALRTACIDQLPGYDDAPWGFADRAYFTKLAALK